MKCLIAPKGNPAKVEGFEDAATDKVKLLLSVTLPRCRLVSMRSIYPSVS